MLLLLTMTAGGGYVFHYSQKTKIYLPNFSFMVMMLVTYQFPFQSPIRYYCRAELILGKKENLEPAAFISYNLEIYPTKIKCSWRDDYMVTELKGSTKTRSM
jgi:hypothetical protein